MRRTLASILSFLFVLLTGLADAGAAAPLHNRLLGNPSPYLAMHAGDPVAWQIWDRKAVAAARAQNKLLYISIGYFSCRWCHVMQRESYRNPEIARFLNAHFIPVKVDRELDPVLDARMSEFASETQGTSGWPLNVFLTPGGYPLYAVFYLPPKDFLDVLQHLQGLWAKEPQRLREIARQAEPVGHGPGSPHLDPAVVRSLVSAVVQRARELEDPFNGGFGGQSKFPSVPQLDFLLAYLRMHPDADLRKFMILTLDHMAQEGLQDHLGGGFFRYTIDSAWRRPHFEKMLYENALLARLYARAGRQFHRPDYAAIARRTRNFMVGSLERANGGMVAALSALDDQGVEGGYYLWTETELKRILPAGQLGVYRRARGMIDQPPFDHGYLPLGLSTAAAKSLGMDLERLRAVVDQGDARLLTARGRRHVPVDGKQLAGWNGLALSAFVEAARFDGDGPARAAAARIHHFLMAELWDGKKLRRAVSAGREIGEISLEDYAFVARGLTDWALLTGEAADAKAAAAVAERGWHEFYGRHGWRLGSSTLIAPESAHDAIEDGPMPSPSAALIRVSLDLARMRGDMGLRRRALAALNSGTDLVRKDPFWYATRIGAMDAAVVDADPSHP